MNARFFVCMVMALFHGLGAAQNELTIMQGNSSLTVTRDPPTFNLGGPSDPVQLPRQIEWVVDGRRIVVYASGPWGFIDIGHFHIDAHVADQQIHAQGPMLGHATGVLDGGVTGGAVYTVQGGPAGSGISRIVEKVDIHNKTSASLPVSLTGMGFKPTQASLEVPDYTGLDVSGTTTVFHQGHATWYSIADPGPFPPSVVQPVVSFKGFNPLFNQSFSLPAGAVLTMITELNLRPRVLTLCDLIDCSRHIGLPMRPVGPPFGRW